jgi:HD-GYP domain-containing protein (c-di-GMP phosphodiesterase class II)
MELAIIHGGTEQVTADDSDRVKGNTEIPSNESAQARSSSDSATPHETITRYKESLQQADAVYKQPLTQSSTALNDIRKGSEADLTTAKEMINSLTDLVLDDATSSAMESLLNAQDLDDVSVFHVMNVAVLSMLVGGQFDLSHEQIKMLGIAGLLHDIGEQMLPPPAQWRGQHDRENRKAFQQHVDFSSVSLRNFPGCRIP